MERVLNLPETRRAPRGANALVLPVDHDRARGCASSDVLRHRQALFGHARSDKGIADRVATHDVPLLRDVLRGTRAGDMRGRVAQRLVQHDGGGLFDPLRVARDVRHLVPLHVVRLVLGPELLGEEVAVAVAVVEVGARVGLHRLPLCSLLHPLRRFLLRRRFLPRLLLRPQLRRLVPRSLVPRSLSLAAFSLAAFSFAAFSAAAFAAFAASAAAASAAAFSAASASAAWPSERRQCSSADGGQRQRQPRAPERGKLALQRWQRPRRGWHSTVRVGRGGWLGGGRRRRYLGPSRGLGRWRGLRRRRRLDAAPLATAQQHER